jgi:hypothetical protein
MKPQSPLLRFCAALDEALYKEGFPPVHQGVAVELWGKALAEAKPRATKTFHTLGSLRREYCATAAEAFENGSGMADADCLEEMAGTDDLHAADRAAHIASGHGDD